VFDGTAIYNALLRHPAKVNVQIDGLAASMASIIALAGDTVEMAENAFFMIHNPWSVVVGDSEDMRKEADILDKLSETAVKTYTRNSKLSEDDVRAAMSAETWYSADEAKKAGFIDSVFTGSEPESLFDLSVFAHAPDGMSATHEHKADARGLEAILREVGMSKKEAKDYIHDLSLGRCEADPDHRLEADDQVDEELMSLIQHRGKVYTH
jgi:enoyl-CoA hydratase/carnithine racemase